jgi:hypothetical protein
LYSFGYIFRESARSVAYARTNGSFLETSWAGLAGVADLAGVAGDSFWNAYASNGEAIIKDVCGKSPECFSQVLVVFIFLSIFVR